MPSAVAWERSPPNSQFAGRMEYFIRGDIKQRIATGLSGDLGAIAVSDRRFEAILLRDAVDAAEDRAAIEIPAALGVTIGFNSLDGD